MTPTDIAIDGTYAGLIAVADPVKESSACAIAALHKTGITVVKITGDSRRTAQSIASEIAKVHVGHIEVGDSDLGGAYLLVNLPAS